MFVIDEKLDGLDIQIKKQTNENETCRRLEAIEGIGPMTALAIIALAEDRNLILFNKN